MWHNAFPILAALIAGLVQLHRTRKTINFRGGAKYPASPIHSTDANLLTDSEKEEYHRDGFILKKGLLQGDALADMISAGEELYASQHALDAVFNKSFKKLSFELWRKDDRFAQLAFESHLPSLSAELLDITPSEDSSENTAIPSAEQSVRILRDGFFGFRSTNNTGCGFHVDDKYFWPASDESTGVNFWVALSPMRITEGGGIRVVNQSLAEPFFEECLKVISKPVFPPITCEMETHSPDCHKQMLEASMVFDMEPGDALIWDRWTFHRTEPFVTEGEEHRLRYTIRYVPGTAEASGYHHDSQKPGEVFNSPHYPQVWPLAVKSEIDAIQRGLDKDQDLAPLSTLKKMSRKALTKLRSTDQARW
jgi:ectoine hydroxylase-related dioxygenase (phytanoyl-CoA dioxygenase family)